ncbi:lpxtg-motif cell wall anchor domain [Trichoderma cornu-damae]|uniref:Lpxtg-motif cell wall anchor domain n=1 Tax=Trichoderma cornu-damae TaxID=654480 RepID=A0A9P8QW21_9HYPO|nr:lpxtg-motif cell wall anchor domain [Trichoderma cornu-damae]
MTETAASFTTARYGQAASSSTAASLPGKTLPAPPASSIAGPSSNLHSHRQSHNSSKLPSFRFADIKNATNGSSHPPLPHAAKQPLPLPLSPRQLAPPVASIVSADSQLDASRSDGLPASAKTRSELAQAKVLTSSATARNRQAPPASGKAGSPPRPNLRPRASYHTSVKPSVVEQYRRVRRPVSYPDSLADEAAQSTKASGVARASSLKQSARRLPASRGASGTVTPDGPRSSLGARPPAIEEAVSPTTRVVPDPRPAARERAQTRRDLPSSKQQSSSGPSDELQDQSLQRPPVSHYKPPVNNAAAGQPTASAAVRVPPIRAFRSSGSRKSSIDDMNFNSRSYDMEDRYVDSTDDHTLRALDGELFDQRSPPTSRNGTNGDDTGDVFLKIASEEAARHAGAENSNDNRATSQYQVNRTTYQRPLSHNVTSYYPMSPPSLGRRLSDQQDREPRRSVRYEDELTSEIARSSAFRSQPRDKAASSRPAEDTHSKTTSSGLRPSLMTPRSAGLQDQDNSLYSRRRSSVMDGPASGSARSSAHKATVLVQSQSRTYNPSPLTRSFEIQEEDDGPDAGNLVEGTESTTSTNAPSTVWDELDDLKSRIHRLELTGKLPPTSAAAVIKTSEERPPTATTTVTTMSISPKKSAAGQQADAGSTTSSQREAHSNLHSALVKIKAILSPDVYRALETAANDALALSSMMGTPGQPGPISGSASVAGGSGITDRQLRRRTDSVCRSLTELCIALGEGIPRPAATVPQVVTTQLDPNPNPHLEPPVTPTMMGSKTYSVSRRSSAVPEQAIQVISSPRAMSKFEERRSMILNGSILTSPRNSASTPATPSDSMAARRASLIVARSRRAVTEEPEDGRRSSALLRRSRVAGEESDDGGRRTSFLVRSRRNTVGEEDEGSRFRAPSRAITEVSGGARGTAKEYPYVSDAPTPAPEAHTPQPPPALGRRRYITSNLPSSRLTVPSTSSTASSRKFLERSLPEGGESGPERPSEGRLSRHLSVQQHGSGLASTYHSLQNRTSSLQFRRTNRESMVIPASSTTASNGLR